MIRSAVGAHLVAGELARAQGMLERAHDEYQAALAAEPYHPVALKAMAELFPQPDGVLLERIETAIARFQRHELTRRILHFAAGKCCDDLNLYERAWWHFTQGNALERARIQYRPEDDEATLGAMRAAFPGPVTTARLKGDGGIFIVGLPRCGSSLLEQCLSAHPEVFSLGESAALPDAVTELAAPEAPGPLQFGAIDAHQLAMEYRWRAGLNPQRLARWTDKQLLNFVYVPLILKAFPRARIVHLTRAPLAQAFALYRVRFQGSWQCSYELTEIARFMVAYRRAMEQWTRLAPGHVHTLAHEALLSDLPGAVRGVLAFCDLPRHEACHRPQEAARAVKTMSAVQVREPLQRERIEAWRPYERYLEPVRRILKEAGYPA